MKKYNPEGWRVFGETVRRVRKRREGYADTTEWASAVHRSTRQVLGMERGEPVGDETIDNVERALGWPMGIAHCLLIRDQPAFWDGTFEEWRQALVDGRGDAVLATKLPRHARERLLVLTIQNIDALRMAAEYEMARIVRDTGDVERAEAIRADVEAVAEALLRAVRTAAPDPAYDDVDVVTRTVAADPGESPGAIAPEPDAAAP